VSKLKDLTPVEKLAWNYVEMNAPFVQIMGVSDPRVEAAIQKAFEAGYQTGHDAGFKEAMDRAQRDVDM